MHPTDARGRERQQPRWEAAGASLGYWGGGGGCLSSYAGALDFFFLNNPHSILQQESGTGAGFQPHAI